MKRSFVTFLILLSLLKTSTVCGQQSNQGTKADCIADAEQIRKLVYNRDILLEQRNTLIERVNRLQSDNQNYAQAIRSANKQIDELKNSDSVSVNSTKLLRESIEHYKQIIIFNGQDIARLSAQLKKQQRRTKTTAFFGVAATTAAVILLIIK